MIQNGTESSADRMHKNEMEAGDQNDLTESNATGYSIDEEVDNYTTSDARFIKDYEECPNCAEGDNRWIYRCEDCGFTGCYDGVFDNGCYMGDEDERACPDCVGKERVRIGRVGAGSADEFIC